MTSPYLSKIFVKNIDANSIKTIVECGSRDCLDAKQLNRYYNPERIYAFECNPESMPICRFNVINTKIQIIQKAVCDKDEMVIFYPTDMEMSNDKNIGASSLLWHRDQDQYIQKKIIVQGIRLDSFMDAESIDKIDLLCFDLQGAEHLAIEGLGKRIKDVHYIISEVSYKSFYHNDVLFTDFEKILIGKGFRRVADQPYGEFGDCLFINENF
jgi:FkbM family methyltransferase